MKTSLSITCIILLLMACESKSVYPLLNEMNGQWKLVKIGIGFPSMEGPKEIIPDYEEILEFNAVKNSFTRKKDGKVIESSDVSIATDDKAAYRENRLVFEKTNMYSFISFTEAPRYLVLSQSTPVGAILADGNSFFYEKIK